MSDAEIEQLFMSLDTNTDGMVDEDEFAAGYASYYLRIKNLPAWVTALPGVAAEYAHRGSIIPRTERRGITLHQLESLVDLFQRVVEHWPIEDSYNGQRVTWKRGNLYHLCENILKPLTARDQCSWVELVASGAQDPLWFVSHAWSTCIYQTMSMLSWHASVHQYTSHNAYYWICTTANNQVRCCTGSRMPGWIELVRLQHNLEELSGRLADTPFCKVLNSIPDPDPETRFWKALKLSTCEGIVQLMDDRCTPIRRIWCLAALCVSVASLSWQVYPRGVVCVPD